MKTLTDFKKRIQIGAKVACTYHQETKKDANGKQLVGEDGRAIRYALDRGVREVSQVQTNAFTLKTTKTDGSIVDSWCHYPKASQCTFEDGKITINETNREGVIYPLLTYSFPN